MSEPIQPALTPEEWAHPMRCTCHGDIVDCDIGFGQLSRHVRAALCLYGQPFGFTQQDVDMLRELSCCPHHNTLAAALAVRIAALLPPPPTPE